MEKSLIVVDGTLSEDSFLRTQLGLDSLFEFRIGGRGYREILRNRLNEKLGHHTILWRDEKRCGDLSVSELRQWLEHGVPGLRDYKNVFVYPAGAYFENFPELSHVIERSAGSNDIIRLGIEPDLFALPLRLLDDVNSQHRKISSLEPDFRWAVKSRIYNLESATDLFSVCRTSTEGRFFNTFEIHGPMIKKTSTAEGKSQREHFVLSHLPAAVRPFFPQVGECQGNSYSLEYVPCFDLGRHFIHGKLTDAVRERFFVRLDQYFESCPRRTVPPAQAAEAFQHLFVVKVKERLSELRAQDGFATLDGMARSVWPEGIDHFGKKLAQELTQAAARWNRGELVFSHGDLCLSNILFDCSNGLMKLIDPRGASDEGGLYLPQIYDLAKLSHSFLGLYDLIKNQMCEVTLDKDLAMRTEFALPVEYLKANQTAFQQWLAKSGYALTDVRLAEASLFLSMLPLHKDQPRHQLLMFMRAVSAWDHATQGGLDL